MNGVVGNWTKLVQYLVQALNSDKNQVLADFIAEFTLSVIENMQDTSTLLMVHTNG